jgi:integrase
MHESCRLPVAHKHHTLLAQQPVSISGLDAAACAAIVISAVRDGGVTTIISRFGDLIWELWPFFKQSNVSPAHKRINWSRFPASFVPGIKAILYRYWIAGQAGRVRPEAVTVVGVSKMLRIFARWLEHHGVTRFADVRPIHIAEYVRSCERRGLSERVRQSHFLAIDLLYTLREHSPDALPHAPFAGSSSCLIAGITNPHARKARTPVIPEVVVEELFKFAESILDAADRLLDERDQNKRSLYKDPALTMIRTACYFLLGLLTGMRNEELVGIETGAHRTTVEDGVTYHWISSVEHKTHHGPDEWMVPALGERCVKVMERWAKAYQQMLEEIIAADIAELKEISPASPKRAAILERVALSKAARRRLFLGIKGGCVAPMSCASTNLGLRALAAAAGVQWVPTSHQLRRTFTASCAAHALGDLVYIKKHLKHRSMDMTALYALNERQDPDLFDEILTEIQDRKVSLIEHWLSPESLLAGGASIQIRKHKIESIESRRALAEDTAEKVHIRATGHSWCLAQDDGCGGQGLWEATRCSDCTNGLIDEALVPVWRGIYAQQLELRATARDCGPGAAKRIERDLERATKVLKDLGVPVNEVGD